MESKEYYNLVWLEGKSLLIMIGDFNIHEVPFLDLNIGDKITQVGSSCSCDKYSSYITYAGIRHEKMPTDIGTDNITKILLFKVRDKDKPKGIGSRDNLYLGYIILKNNKDSISLKTVNYSSKTTKIYKTSFTKLEENS